MDDTRIRRVLALADDARCLLSDIYDEGPPFPGSHYIAVAHSFIDRAIKALNEAYTPPEGDTAA